MSFTADLALRTMDILHDMRDRGTSVDVNWGDDNQLWEVSWITGGVRYTAFSTGLYTAVMECYRKVVPFPGTEVTL